MLAIRRCSQFWGFRYGAKCLNGAAPTVEVRLNKSSTKWVLFLEGGGWCYGATENATIASCASRGGFVPGGAAALASASARLRAGKFSGADYGGIMGSSPDTNPDFHTWNAIFIHCKAPNTRFTRNPHL